MNTRRRKLVVLFTSLLLLLLAGTTGLWLRSARHQYALNRQLIAALVKNDTSEALALIDEGADPNTRYAPTPVPSLPELGRQLFHRSPVPTNNSPTALAIVCGAPWDDDKATYMAQERRPDVPRLAQAMLRHGAKVNAKDDSGSTPLSWAIGGNRLSTAGMLLEHGADVNAKDANGWTPLISAVRSGDGMQAGTAVQRVRLLLEHGADINAQNDDGTMPLEGAVDCRDQDTVRLLLQNGANINALDGTGSTPLISATIRVCVDGFSPDMVRLLLTLGADPNISAKDGKTPLMWAQEYKRRNLITLLKQAGARK